MSELEELKQRLEALRVEGERQRDQLLSIREILSGVLDYAKAVGWESDVLNNAREHLRITIENERARP